MKMDSLISPALGAATGLVGNLANVYMQNQTNKENQELAKQNNQFNIDMWNRQNEYNKPVNQMQRLKDAGLNTSLMYGNVTNQAISMPTADTSNKATAPRVNMDSLASNAQQMYLSQQLAKAQIDNTNAQTQSTLIDNQKKIAEQPYYETNAKTQSQGYQLNNEHLNQSINYVVSQISNIDQDTLNKQLSGKELEANVDYLNKTMQARVQKTVNDWAISTNNVKISSQEAKNVELQAKLLVQQILTEQVHRSDIATRLKLFQSYTDEQIKSATMSNERMGIDLSNYKKLRGDAYNTSTYGLVMRVVDDIFGSLGQVLGGSFKLGK